MSIAKFHPNIPSGLGEKVDFNGLAILALAAIFEYRPGWISTFCSPGWLVVLGLAAL